MLKTFIQTVKRLDGYVGQSFLYSDGWLKGRRFVAEGTDTAYIFTCRLFSNKVIQLECMKPA
jgi:hypothetical protein